MRYIALIICIIFNMVGFTLAQEENLAHLRIVHLSADMGEVEIYINQNGRINFQDVFGFSDYTDWVDVDSNTTYSVIVVPVDEDIENAIVEVDIMPETSDWLTIAIIGEFENDEVKLQILSEEYSALDEFQSRLSVFHALPNYEPVNVIVNDVELIRYLGYPGFWGPDSDGFISFVVLSQISDIRLEQQDGSLAVELEDIALGGNRHYLLAIAGISSNPQYVLIGSDLQLNGRDE